MFAIGIIGLLFTIWEKVKTPQIKADKIDALLSQKVEFTNKATTDRFCEINKKYDDLLLQSNNHIHTVDTKVERLIEVVGVMGKDIVKLSTILEERLPKK